MANYDPRRFSQEFSKRTESNLEHIRKMVHSKNYAEEITKRFVEQYQESINEFDNVIISTRQEIKCLENEGKGKSELRKKLFNITSKLENNKKHMENQLAKITSVEKMQDDKLYEVTQMLNSLMGIAVLPFEMHKEYFGIKNDGTEDNSAMLAERQKSLENCEEYENLKTMIMFLYKEGRWRTNYKKDLCSRSGEINEKRVVFRFLYHLRNATCHSGDNAISIIPLYGGTVIESVKFYDKNLNQEGTLEEFAMWLSIEELEKMVTCIAAFYRESKLGTLDKTGKIKAAEQRVSNILGITELPRY